VKIRKDTSSRMANCTQHGFRPQKTKEKIEKEQREKPSRHHGRCPRNGNRKRDREEGVVQEG